MQESVAKFPATRVARSELTALRSSLEALERSVADLESAGPTAGNGGRRATKRRTKLKKTPNRRGSAA